MALCQPDAERTEFRAGADQQWFMSQSTYHPPGASSSEAAGQPEVRVFIFFGETLAKWDDESRRVSGGGHRETVQQ